MHSHILENIHALLDFNNVPKGKDERTKYFSDTFKLTLRDSESVLIGEQVPNKKLLREIADKFEVDPLWLIKN